MSVEGEESNVNNMSMEVEDIREDETNQYALDCYPYTFTPLLLFCESTYFDKGYSNYNSVAQFFQGILPVNMLENVLYERKNMLYEELLEYIVKEETLVTCCIDSHFIAFQVIKDKKKPVLLYYDPLKPSVQQVTGGGFKIFALYLLLKCNYGDSQHIQENRDHYIGIGTNGVRKTIYQLWRKINKIESPRDLFGISYKPASLNMKKYLLINDPIDFRNMSTQQTSNTCYFQTFL